MKKYSFDIDMRTKDMYAFLLRQQYIGFRGLVNLIIVAIVIFELVAYWDRSNETTKLFLFFVLILILVASPIQLFLRAKAQAKLSERFKEPTHIDVDEKGITISQNGEIVGILWGHLMNYKNTSKRIYVYTSKITAFIFPKDMMSTEGVEFLIKELKSHKSDFGTLSLETITHIVPEEKNAEDEA